ncbi:MAG: hypothetical protein ABIG68_04950 [Acidobacteriota bacterium]
MTRTVIFTAALCLLATTATAQRMGSINRNVPTIEQKIDLGPTGTIKLSYSGISWGSGSWAKSLGNEERQSAMRDRINQSADQNPLGSFECSKDVKIGDVMVPAGSYKLAFKLDEEFAWQLVLAQGEQSIPVPLSLMETEEQSKRLVLSLYAGDEDFTGGLYLAFGEHFGMMTIAPAPKKDKD